MSELELLDDDDELSADELEELELLSSQRIGVTASVLGKSSGGSSQTNNPPRQVKF